VPHTTGGAGKEVAGAWAELMRRVALRRLIVPASRAPLAPLSLCAGRKLHSEPRDAEAHRDSALEPTVGVNGSGAGGSLGRCH
jgi:hypothetical protein